ncbi:Two-component response regulator, YesN/AraC family, consists of REC and AraC-type DNA-binding domains [Pilibacter termitis]|uniref:Two-component response regulator, YesN/AraC family, consists of REC and AraC-type DNA-binding domains n=1 Tax=Pilibacter termitis TaxID=263852 RepID=A0A1T4R980_9ENTE|nr:response regulator [Pilibacter termitis]SKA12489.1 Two-component response regulator, YesN/AraC family, consists of REC and AraC-type DNA-binding domains [Pilibacter termitis]
MKIVIVDDERIIVQGLAKMLQQSTLADIEYFYANNGLQALEIILEEKIDIALLDINMPEMDGLKLAEVVYEQNLPTKIIIISGYDDFHYARSALKVGVEDYLLKPVSEEALIESVEKVMTKVNNSKENKTLSSFVFESKEKEIFLRRVLHGELTYQEICLLGEKYQISEGKRYKMLVLSFSEKFTNEKISELSQIFNRVQKKLHIRFFLTVTDYKRMALLFEDYPFVSEIVEEIKKDRNVSFFATFSDRMNNFFQLKEDYLTNMMLQEYASLLAKSSILSLEEVEEVQKEKQIQMYRELLKSDKKEEIHSFFQTLTTTRLLEVHLWKMYYDEKKTQEKWISEIILSLSKMSKKESLKKLERATELLLAEKNVQENFSPIVERAISLIKQDLSYKHSLKTLSGELKMNPTYLGQLFSKEVGENFSSFNRKIRMKKAQKLLKNSSLKIRDVAKTVGYEDLSRFYKVYKEYYGFTPNDARRGIEGKINAKSTIND